MQGEGTGDSTKGLARLGSMTGELVAKEEGWVALDSTAGELEETESVLPLFRLIFAIVCINFFLPITLDGQMDEWIDG